ncbi:LTA synthase family protein [Bdellovibrio bacteriovorus]
MKLNLPKNYQTLYGLLFLTVLSLILQSYAFHYILPVKLLLPWILYFSCLVFLRPYFAVGFVLLLEGLFARIHILKLSHTNSAFEAADIFEWKQALFLKGYTDFWVPVLFIGLVAVFIKGLSFKKKQLVFLPVLVVLIISCVQQRKSNEAKWNAVGSLFKLAKVVYVDWDFPKDVKENGILGHLFLTLPILEVPRPGPVSFTSKGQNDIIKESPDVFLVLCESCYTNPSDFVTPLSSLEQLGFTYTTLVSPVYGGLTAEAEFESLTGLPSQRFKGVDYQYFAERFSENAQALPRVFQDSGYHTNSFHNNVGSFWRRNVVHPRFGFKQSFFIEDMNWKGDFGQGFPEDDILFHKVFSEYQKNLKENKKTFSFVITIHTHGPYNEVNDDGGEAHYIEKMKTSMAQFTDFQNKVLALAKEKNRPVVFLVFGDHKPAMTISFYKRHVFKDDFFESVDTKRDFFQFASLSDSQKVVYGRVPLYVKAVGLNAIDFSKSFSTEIKDRPIYCLPGIIANHVELKSQYYGFLGQTCEERSPKELVDKQILKDVFKEEVYGNVLFAK